MAQTVKNNTLLFKAICRRMLLCTITAILTLQVKAQDIHFSQVYESPLNLNPALCGQFRGDYYAEANYRNQWTSVMGGGDGFNTIDGTFEAHNITKNWNNGYLAPGLMVYNDKSGDARANNTEISATVGSGVFVGSKSTLAAGIQFGWAQNSINLANIPWDEQYINGHYDPNAPTGETTLGNSISYVDFSGGLLYSYYKAQTSIRSNDQVAFNIGGAVFHVNQPNNSFYGQSGTGNLLYMRYVGHANGEFGIKNTNVSLIPEAVYFLQGPSQEIDAGMKIRYLLKDDSKYTKFVKGAAFDMAAYYRWNDAIIALFQMEFGNYSLGFSYDMNITRLSTLSNGTNAFEISLRFLTPNPFTNTGILRSRSMF